jgi:antitoxin (DNA-binding transcriptional repressor) of toxin-antitoxin stability system
MHTINMHEAKSTLSKLIEYLETGHETEVIIARNGTPVARLTPFVATARFGAAKHLLGNLDLPATIEQFNQNDTEIAAEFEASAQSG